MKAAWVAQNILLARRLIAILFALTSSILLHAPTPEAKAYAIAKIQVTDPVGYRNYLAAVTPIVAHYGGRYIARAGQVVPIEGSAPAGRFVIIEFPSLAVARQFESSREYRSMAPLRQRAARTRLFLVEGVPSH